MAATQRWSRKRGWAAAFQGAEVVGEHYAANRGGVAIAGPQHISSSVPTEFEAMLGEAADLAPEGLEHPLPYLRSRILARHFHAMPKRGATLVTVYLEPGMRASGLNLWLLEVLAACILCFVGPWIAMEDWNMEPKDLAQAGWLETVNGKVAATSAASCCPRRWHIWCNRAKWKTTLPLLHIRLSVSPSWPRLGVTGYWPANGPSRSPCVGQWDRDARRSNSNGPGLQRIFLSTCSWPGWSGCAQQKRLGVGSMISAGPNAGLIWGGAKDWSSSTFPSARPRATTRGDAAGGWQHGRLEEGASFAGYVATVSQLARLHLVTRSWPLGSRLGFSVTRSSGTHSAQSCNLWGLGRPGHKGHGFHQESHTTSS